MASEGVVCSEGTVGDIAHSPRNEKGVGLLLQRSEETNTNIVQDP